MLTEKEMMMKKKAQFLLEKQKVVHITFNNGKWANGTIEEVSDQFFTIEEKKEGAMLIFYREIFEIEAFTLKDGVERR